jgi:FG-GAP-like repeat
MHYTVKRLGGGMLLMLAGCTGMGTDPSDPASENFELVADPDAAYVPVVTSVQLGLWFSPMALEIGDFNGDSLGDFVVVGVEPGVGVTAAVFLGDGTGQFAAPIDANFTACTAFPVVGDINGDGRTDMVALGCANDLAVYVGQPDGTLAPWSAWPAIAYTPVSSTVIADFEDDGDSDLVTLRRPGSVFLDIALGNGGQGIWRVETTEVGNPSWSGFNPGGFAMGHFDDDELLDAALIERENDIVHMPGVHPATFGSPRELGVDVAPWSNRVDDLDGDGFDDLVVSSYTSPAVQVLLADGTGGFLPQDPIAVVGFAPYDTALGDITGDGVPDVAMVDADVAQIRWWRGGGDGSLLNLRVFNLPAPAIRIHAGHFDGDEREDLVVATFDDDTVTLVLSNN